MVALIFNAPPIDHEAADLGDNEHVTSDGEILKWSEMSLWHLTSKASSMRKRIDDGLVKAQADRCAEEVIDQVVILSNDLDDLLRYIEYRNSVGNVHGD
jgi:hypothetical protein